MSHANLVEDWLAFTYQSQLSCLHSSALPRDHPTPLAKRKREPQDDFRSTQSKRSCRTDWRMSEEGSTISNTTPSLSSRPILVPTPPSSKRSTAGKRSPSPTRKLLALIKDASPPVHVSQPGNAVIQPASVSDLRSYLSKGIGMNIIPRALEVKSLLNCDS